MDGALTRGQAPALAAVRTMISGRAPHAVLLTGPGAVGKSTLALDLAAGLLCTAASPSDRPCRACRGCRLVASGNHPDLHRLAPGGPGNQIKIGWTPADPRPGVRDLIEALSLMSAEGGSRVAIVEGAHRMNEDAQNALLKTLEEPPPGVVIVLCADDEERLLPTIRSRCQRVRLGTVSGREIEAWLSERDLADAPTAARAARLADGRPGLALAYVRAPAAMTARGELDRTLLDLLVARPSARLAATDGLLTRARDLATQLTAGGGAADAEPTTPTPRSGPGSRGRRAARGSAATLAPPSVVPGGPSDDTALDGDAGAAEPATDGSGRTVRVAAPERRRGALALLEIWRRLALELVRAERGESRQVHDPALLEEIATAARRVPAGSTGAFLRRLDEVGQAIDGNASPELAIDVLVLAWPAA